MHEFLMLNEKHLSVEGREKWVMILLYNARDGKEKCYNALYRVGVASKIVNFALYNMYG